MLIIILSIVTMGGVFWDKMNHFLRKGGVKDESLEDLALITLCGKEVKRREWKTPSNAVNIEPNLQLLKKEQNR